MIFELVMLVQPHAFLWTESVTAGSAEFVECIKAKLGIKAKYRRISNYVSGAAYALKEATVPYNVNFDCRKAILRNENRLLWQIFFDL
ncbi:MAG: hypothetical protein U5L07_05210 [Desulfobacterales bacterium]|nr:hypothetical protein [Desulfobacterales bacterium]